MRLYRRGDQGEPVRDIQDRLCALGYPRGDDASGTYDTGTESAVRAFQDARGLPVDGIVGPMTWRALVDAGFALGDRMLIHRVPMMRGDDVAELQQRLNALGFDTGKVDGIFGPDTQGGLLEFQANRRLAEDGMVGPEVVAELRLVGSAADRVAVAAAKEGRDVVRERQWLRDLPHHLAGQRIYVDAQCRDEIEAEASWRAARMFSRIVQDLGALPVSSREVDGRPNARVRAVRSNRLGVDFVVSFARTRHGKPAVYYFATKHSHSSAGLALAEAVAAVIGVETKGRSIPMLKDTRAPSIVVSVEDLDEKTGGAVAQGIINLFAEA